MAEIDDILKKLEDNLDYHNGGGLHVKQDTSKLIDAPVLLIGLGGTGAKSLIRIKKLISDRIGGNKPENLEYLSIDTDDRINKMLYSGVGFSSANSEVCIIKDTELLTSYLNREISFGSNINEWLSNDIDVQHITDGAGCVRQVGRLLLFREINKIESTIRNKVAKITKNNMNKSKYIYVFIVTGISGGTGSGTFIDIPFVVRHIIEDMLYRCKVFGFLFLPDVNLQHTSDPATVTNLKRNGFAALKELDYVMNLGKGGNGEIFEQDYGSFKVTESRKPYDMCYLISSINAVNQRNYTSENCMGVVAETIINFIADEPGVTGQDYSIESYLTNSASLKSSSIKELGEHKDPINYAYNTIGCSSAILPLDDVINYLTHKMFKAMSDIYECKPNENDLKEIINSFDIDPHKLSIYINKNVSLSGLENFTFEDIKANPNICIKALNNNISKLETIMNANKDDFIKNFEGKSELEFNTLFTDLKKGPFYVSRLIYTVEGNSNTCLLNYLREIDKQLIAQKPSEEKLESLRHRVDVVQTKLVQYSPLAIDPMQKTKRKTLLRDYKEACEEYYRLLLNESSNKVMRETYSRIYNIVNDYNNNVFSVYKIMLTKFKELFADYGEINTNVGIATKDDDTILSWNIVEPKDLIQKIELLAEDKTIELNFDESIKKLLEELIKNSNNWLKDSEGLIAEKFNNFIIIAFSGVTQKSIDFYIEKLAGNNEDGFIRKTVEELKLKSNVMFPANSVMSGRMGRLPIYEYVVVPTNTLKFNDTSFNIGDTNGNLKQSVINNRIFMLNTNIAVPLLYYSELCKYEETYEKFIGQKEGIGMHLYENKNSKDWSKLPSPVYDELYASDYFNTRQKRENDKLRDIFNKSLNYGYIYWDENVHVCRYGKPFDVNSILKSCNIDDIENSTISIADATKAKNLIEKQFNERNKNLESSQKLYNSKFAADGIAPDIDYSMGIFINMPVLNKTMTKMVAEHERITNIINKLKSVSDGAKDYERFAIVISADKIFKKRGKYYYLDASDMARALCECPIGEDSSYFVFEAFRNLSESEKKNLYSKSMDYQSQLDDDDFEKYLTNIQSIQDEYAKIGEDLATNYESIEDGEKKAMFYRIMEETLGNIYLKYK